MPGFLFVATPTRLKSERVVGSYARVETHSKPTSYLRRAVTSYRCINVQNVQNVQYNCVLVGK